MQEYKVDVPSLQGATHSGGKPAPGWTSYTIFKCDRCKRIRQSTNAFTTGYGRNDRDERICFECCGDTDREAMETADKYTLYLTKEAQPNGPAKWYVSNWPGSLRFPVYGLSAGAHNIAGKRRDFRFKDHTGRVWAGVQYGDNTDIAHCRKLKVFA